MTEVVGWMATTRSARWGVEFAVAFVVGVAAADAVDRRTGGRS